MFYFIDLPRVVRKLDNSHIDQVLIQLNILYPMSFEEKKKRGNKRSMKRNCSFLPMDISLDRMFHMASVELKCNSLKEAHSLLRLKDVAYFSSSSVLFLTEARCVLSSTRDMLLLSDCG